MPLPFSLQGCLTQAQYANEVGVKRAPNFTPEQRSGLVWNIFEAYQRAKAEGRRYPYSQWIPSHVILHRMILYGQQQ